MKYLLHLNHPKGEKVFKLNKIKERRARKYFSVIPLIDTVIEVRGEKIKAKIDYQAFEEYANFDCFNCQDSCCGGNPIIYEKKSRDFILENFKRYNELTKNSDILEEMGYTETEIMDSIREDLAMVPEEFAEDEIFQCSCCYKPDNQTTLCSIHAIALEKNENFREIVELKPLICSLWPIEIIVEDDMSMAYVTLPNDFTNGFSCENYYRIACVNYSYSKSAIFRRFNPNGFNEEEYKPFYEVYGDTMRYGLGEKFYSDLIKKIKR